MTFEWIKKWINRQPESPATIKIDYSRSPSGLRQLQETADKAYVAAIQALEASNRLEDLIREIKTESKDRRRKPLISKPEPDDEQPVQHPAIVS